MIAAALGSGREWLTEPEAVGPRRLSDPGRADARRADRGGRGGGGAGVGFPVALKILSPDITRKSDVGGVALDLADDAHVRAAGERMLARVRAAAPAARIDGFAVQRWCGGRGRTS